MKLFADQLLMNGVMLSLSMGNERQYGGHYWYAGCLCIDADRFRGQTSFAFLITAPMVMPEVITGSGVTLLFVAMSNISFGYSQRGAMTIWIAHVTFTAYVTTVIVRSRLQSWIVLLKKRRRIWALTLKVFGLIKVTLGAPAIAAGWLLGFTLSVDDLVITSFVSGRMQPHCRGVFQRSV